MAPNALSAHERKKSYYMRVFDTTGSYFTHVFMNQLYHKAQEYTRANMYETVTDGYQSLVHTYIMGVREQKYMEKTVRDLIEYYNKYNPISLAEYQDRLLSCIVPAEYFADFKTAHKDKVFRDILLKVISEMGAFILKRENLKIVIDARDDGDNINVIQDHAVDLLVEQRDHYHELFANELAAKAGSNNYSKEHVSRLKDTIKKLTKENNELKKALIAKATENEQAIGMIRKLVEELQQRANKSAYSEPPRVEPPRQPIRPSVVPNSHSKELLNEALKQPDNKPVSVSAPKLVTPIPQMPAPEVPAPRLAIEPPKVPAPRLAIEPPKVPEPVIRKVSPPPIETQNIAPSDSPNIASPVTPPDSPKAKSQRSPWDPYSDDDEDIWTSDKTMPSIITPDETNWV